VIVKSESENRISTTTRWETMGYACDLLDGPCQGLVPSDVTSTCWRSARFMMEHHIGALRVCVTEKWSHPGRSGDIRNRVVAVGALPAPTRRSDVMTPNTRAFEATRQGKNARSSARVRVSSPAPSAKERVEGCLAARYLSIVRPKRKSTQARRL